MKNYTLLLAFIALFSIASAQQKKSTSPVPSVPESYDQKLFGSMKWRNIGPWRAGRCLAVTGIPTDPMTYYAGQVGGGIWKTTDGGNRWNQLPDSAFGSSSVGAIAVAGSDPNIVYAGMGEVEMRNNISYGDGIYKSTDAGKSWRHTGLKETNAIGTIAVHPRNPDLVYVAAMGKTFGTNKERGLYRSKDGGKTWQQILYKDDSNGCVDVKLDPVNPSVIYASMWKGYRTPHSLWSGGRHSGLYKSTDGGDTWENISENPGMPAGMKGKVIVTIAASDPDRLYAIVESSRIGVYRSDDAGASWSLVSTQNDLTQRPWYFSQLFADPVNENVLYVLNVEFFKSIDAGVHWTKVANLHGDNHDMWINPVNPQNYIMGDDGGPQVTFDGGKNFTPVDLPTAQFYHVNLDNAIPYNVYGAQQDNSSIRIASRVTGFASGVNGGLIGASEWYPVAGGEAGFIVPNPKDPDITVGGEYLGQMSYYNKRTNEYRVISPYPELLSGVAAEKMKYRFNWTYPIAYSPHDENVLYTTSNYVHRSKNMGKSWELISPDLTRHDPSTMKESGGPITLDMTGAEVYATIFAFAESPVKAGVLWAGSDDGYVSVTQDNGKNWSNVTPKSLPDFALISYVEPSHFDPAVCYVSATRYKKDDNRPYLFKTSDYGKTWQLISSNLPADMYNRCLREDPIHKGILYCGTENGIWISFNDGASWQSLKLNLPNTPVTDIQVHPIEHDLVIATHGRSFWILDDITPLYQLSREIKESNVHLYKPKDSRRFTSPAGEGGYILEAGENAPAGVITRYYFRQKPIKEVKLLYFNEQGDTLISFSSVKNNKGDTLKTDSSFIQPGKLKKPGWLDANEGMNNFVWDFRIKDAEADGSAEFEGSVAGPLAPPGNYRVKLFLGDSLCGSEQFSILADPRSSASLADLQEQFAFGREINKKLNEVGRATKSIRKTREQINIYLGSVTDTALSRQLTMAAIPILSELDSIEQRLHNPKIKSSEDNLRFPVKLEEKLGGLNGNMLNNEGRPTEGMYEVYKDLLPKVDAALLQLKKLYAEKIPAFNKLAESFKRPAVIM